MNSLFFEEGLYRSIKISEGFLLLCHSLKKIDKSLILNEIIKKTNFSKTDSDKVSTYFNNNYEKKPFETLIYIYTMESNFYRSLNRALTQNIDISYENFLTSMFFHKAKLEKTYVVTSPIVYRSVALKKQNPNDLSNMRQRCEYVIGINYFWPAFTSTSKDQSMSVKTFLTSKLKSDDYDYFLFTIYFREHGSHT